VRRTLTRLAGALHQAPGERLYALEVGGVGVALAGLGLLWFLQGTGLVRTRSVLCFADCECVEGGSLFWTVASAVAFAGGGGPRPGVAAAGDGLTPPAPAHSRAV
jgi:hypothetical protein